MEPFHRKRSGCAGRAARSAGITAPSVASTRRRDGARPRVPSGNRASLCAEMHGLPMVGSANAPYLSRQLTILLTCKNSLLTPVRIRAPRRNRTSPSPHMHNVCLWAADFGGWSAGFGDLAPFSADHTPKSAARARPRPTPTRPRPQPEICATPAIAIHTTHSVAATPTRLQPPPRRPETNAHPVRHSLQHDQSPRATRAVAIIRNRIIMDKDYPNFDKPARRGGLKAPRRAVRPSQVRRLHN